MSNENTQLAERPTSVKDYLAIPAYRDRFHEVMGKRANQFMAAIVASSQLPGLKDAEPRSVIAAAMVAATLDLPVNPTLGQAHLVAYADGSGQKVAQFQIGYKGLIQLALRSGQYKRLNAGPLSAGAFKGYDSVGEPAIDFGANDPTQPSAGYFCAFETLNGFIKVVYWSKAQAEAHAKRFSKAYAKGYSTPWKSDFDSMATKTVIKAALGKWGLLSVEMQKAVVHDQGAQDDVDSDVKYVDSGTDTDASTGSDMPAAVDRPPPPKRSPRGAAAVKQNDAVDVQATPVTEAKPESVKEAQKVADPAPEKKPEPKPVEKVESFEQAAAATPVPVEPKKVEAIVQRALLAPDEAIEVTATIDEFKTIVGKRGGKDHPYVTARITSPELAGQVSQTDGGMGENGQPLPIWQLDRSVRLKLRGKKYSTGAMANIVESITEVSAPAEEV